MRNLLAGQILLNNEILVTTIPEVTVAIIEGNFPGWSIARERDGVILRNRLGETVLIIESVTIPNGRRGTRIQFRPDWSQTLYSRIAYPARVNRRLRSLLCPYIVD